ncbi:MAG TPA: 2-C-methyl-D-erythritol 4-phosphate cytidylyltransferase [Gemmatimonadales bacterium]|nr:2-C-methyl-D-erythritol 4-phosphate cytidylyltransferase [Gemmatimonadales bacterium]
MPRDVGVVVVAAGKGSRFGGDMPKQYLDLGGSPVLLHAIRPFVSHPDVAATVVVLPAEDSQSPPQWLAPLVSTTLRVVAGGATRRESVAAGMAALPEECATVLVHDGARPFPSREVIDATIAAARGGVGVIPAIPVSDTIKRADDFGLVLGTVPRAGLWRAQTPQGFPRALLQRAHSIPDAVDQPATDDAMLVELAGGRVELVPGSRRNIKITTAEDLALAEWLLTRP